MSRKRGDVSQYYNANTPSNVPLAAAPMQMARALQHIGQRVTSEQTNTRGSSNANYNPLTSAMQSLDRLTTDIGPGARMKRSYDTAMFSSIFRGGNAPVPEAQEARFKRQSMPSNSNIPVRMHHTSTMKPGKSVTTILYLDGEAYGSAAQSHGAMLNLMQPGVAVWVCKYSGTNAGKNMYVEVRDASVLNRTSLNNARAGAEHTLLDYHQFCQVWAQFGVAKYLDPRGSAIAGGPNASILTVTMDGMVQVPGFWLDWKNRLQVGDTLWFIYVARTLGYEEEERRFMLEGNPYGFFEFWEKADADRRAALPARLQQQQQILTQQRRDDQAFLTGDAHPSSAPRNLPALSLSTKKNDAESDLLRVLPNADRQSVRYPRWETYVTSNGLPPPKWVYRTVSPTGEKHNGGCRPIIRVTNNQAVFDNGQMFAHDIKLALYADPYLVPNGHMDRLAHLPKITGLAYSSHA